MGSLKRIIDIRALAGLLILIAIARVVATYHSTSQGFDEPCHVAAAIELLDKRTYTLDPVHPPLSRIAIGVPLYLAGERFPRWQSNDPRLANYNDVGNGVLYDDGHYLRNLSLARLGEIPFLLICAVGVFVWTRRASGDLAALAAVGLLTTVPTVLAFSGLAYSDVPTACTQSLAIFLFTYWLERPSRKTTAMLGISLGLALATKLTSLIFLLSSFSAILLLRYVALRRQPRPDPVTPRYLRRFSLACILAILVLWATYGFQVGSASKSLGLDPASLPSFQHFPRIVGNAAKWCMEKDCPVPAPAFFRGLAEAWVLNQGAPRAYLFGNIKKGGWPYFFVAALSVKAPIPLLILFIAGVVLVAKKLPTEWATLTPAVAVGAILLATAGVKYNAGLRHVLVVFPLMAPLAGSALATCLSRTQRSFVKVAAAALIAWQLFSTVQASRDPLSYFNESARLYKNKPLLNGCDLDCGQDVFRLRDELSRRHIPRFYAAMWTTADISRMNLPDAEILPPNSPVKGWIAISDRALLEGEVFHKQYPQGSFDWLSAYNPVARVGSTISLYYVP